MYQPYPSYPSQDRYTPPTYHEGQQIRPHSNCQGLYLNTYGRNSQAKNHSTQWMLQQSRQNESSDSYEELLRRTLYDQTCANIENMIHSNTMTIQKLERNNEQLRRHLHYIKKIFAKIPVNKALYLSSPIESVSRNEHNYANQHDKENDSSNTEKNQRKSQLDLHEEKKASKIELQQSRKKQPHQKRAYPVSNGPMKYTKYSWVKEQYFVKEFIKSCLQDRIQVTPQEPFNLVPKSKIMQMYMNWRTSQNHQNELKESRIQTIVTNEMKVVFGCTCTLRDYVGMVFHEESNSLVIKRNHEGTKKVIWRQEGKTVNKSQVQNVKEEMLDEEFSYGESEGQMAVDNQRYVYL